MKVKYITMIAQMVEPGNEICTLLKVLHDRVAGGAVGWSAVLTKVLCINARQGGKEREEW